MGKFIIITLFTYNFQKVKIKKLEHFSLKKEYMTHKGFCLRFSLNKFNIRYQMGSHIKLSEFESVEIHLIPTKQSFDFLNDQSMMMKFFLIY